MGRSAIRMLRSSGDVRACKALYNSLRPVGPAVGLRTYSFYRDVDVYTGGQTGRVIINGYDDAGFFANGVRHEGSVICLGKLTFSWTPRSFDEITPESLSIFKLLRPAPEILVMGCGRNIERISPEVRDFLRSNGIKLEAVDTRNAASTFNFLNEEGRQVAAAMLPQGSSRTEM